MTKPILKWAGGKQKLLKHILPLLPGEFKHYFEPFAGGLAVFFAIHERIRRPRRAYLSDANEDLINVYRRVRYDPDTILEELRAYDKRHKQNADYWYYFFRAYNQKDFVDLSHRAASFIYLNKTCYNGLYRVNKNGEFNVPLGQYKNPNIINKQGILAASQVFRSTPVTISPIGFVEALRKPQRGDFVYLDPPYLSQPGKPSFTSYTTGDFGLKEHELLAVQIDQLTHRGVKVMLSNSAVPNAYLLYRNSQYRIVEIERSNAINSKGGERGPVKELLIMNY